MESVCQRLNQGMRALTNMVELGKVRRSKFYSHCMTDFFKQNQICKKSNCEESDNIFFFTNKLITLIFIQRFNKI